MNDRVHHCSKLEVDALPDWKPMEVTHRLRDVVAWSEIGDESGSGIHNSLQRQQRHVRQSNEDGVAVVDS